MKITPLLFLSLALLAAPLLGAGFSHNENFVVFTPSQVDRDAAEAYAEQVIGRAERYRKEIAEEWLGRALPPSVGRTIITVRFSDQQDRGRTWAKEDLRSRFHNIDLITSRDLATGETLKHEVAHVVLSTQYAGDARLAPWAEEGIASRYDDSERVAIRSQIVHWFAETGNWPDIESVMRAELIPSMDRSSYAVAATLADFLIERRDKESFLRFAETARSRGWNESLDTFYGIRNIDQLQLLWQAWIKRQQHVTTDVAVVR